jgi:hypothetical protein
MEMMAVPEEIEKSLLMCGSFQIMDVRLRREVGLLMSGLSHRVTSPYPLKVGRDQEKVCQGRGSVCLGRAKASLDRMMDGGKGYLFSKRKSKVWKEVREELRHGMSERC